MNLSPEALQCAGCAAIAVAAACLYLGAPNQRWLSRPPPSRASFVVGAALALLGVALWSQSVQLSTAIFATLAMLMLFLIVFPCLAALRAIVRNAP